MFTTTAARTLLVIAASILLSGCFVSVNPLVTGDNIVYPLSAGAYAYYSNDSSKAEYIADIEIRSNGYYSSHADFDHNGAVMRDMGDGLYIVQEPETAGDYVQYGLVKIDGGTAKVWEPGCGDLSESDRIDLNVSKEDDGDCAFTSYPQLREALLIYYGNNKSSPAGRFVRQSTNQQTPATTPSKNRDGHGGGS
jgi:hypothetical protein